MHTFFHLSFIHCCVFGCFFFIYIFSLRSIWTKFTIWHDPLRSISYKLTNAIVAIVILMLKVVSVAPWHYIIIPILFIIILGYEQAKYRAVICTVGSQ